MNKRDEDRIEAQNKRIAGYVTNMFVSMVTAIIVTLLYSCNLK